MEKFGEVIPDMFVRLFGLSLIAAAGLVAHLITLWAVNLVRYANLRSLLHVLIRQLCIVPAANRLFDCCYSRELEYRTLYRAYMHQFGSLGQLALIQN